MLIGEIPADDPNSDEPHRAFEAQIGPAANVSVGSCVAGSDLAHRDAGGGAVHSITSGSRGARKSEKQSVAEFGQDCVMITGPDTTYWFVTGYQAIQDVASTTGLGPADKNIVNPTVGFEFSAGIGIGVVPSNARS